MARALREKVEIERFYPLVAAEGSPSASRGCDLAAAPRQLALRLSC